MKLSIVIPQYKEEEKEIGNLLRSIDIQNKVDWREVEVVIVNDHSDVILSNSFLDSFYNFKPKYFRLQKNSGPGIARQAGIDRAQGDWITLCDSDDILCNVFALHNCLKSIDEVARLGLETKIIIFPWFEEIVDNSAMTDKEYILHEKEGNWLHAKLYNRAYMNKYKIRFSPELTTCCEDRYFLNTFLTRLENHEEKYVAFGAAPIYLWKCNLNSITRSRESDSPTGGRKSLYAIWKCGELTTEYRSSVKELDLVVSTSHIIAEIYMIVSDAQVRMKLSGWSEEQIEQEYSPYLFEGAGSFFRKYGKYFDINVARKCIESAKKEYESHYDGIVKVDISQIDTYFNKVQQEIKKYGN